MRWLMFRTLRRMGIALGSLVAAWLVVGLVAGSLLTYGVMVIVTIILGGLIYRDIIRREHPAD
jgi:hypothetical protein